jgi:hypothetical protein
MPYNQVELTQRVDKAENLSLLAFGTLDTLGLVRTSNREQNPYQGPYFRSSPGRNLNVSITKFGKPGIW